MLRVALTGGIGSGKSTVSDLLAAHGAVVIDADVLAREVVEPGTPALAAIVERFGPSVLADSELDRAALGAIVFADPSARADLESIVHPAVRARSAELERLAPSDAIVVHVIPLLAESRGRKGFDVVVVVDTPRGQQLDRLIRQRGLSREDAERRMRAQASRDQRIALADIVVPNQGTVAELKERVSKLWADLRSTAATR